MAKNQNTAYDLGLESSTVRMGGRGRITVPVRFRERLGLKRGDIFSIVQVNSFLILTSKELIVPKAANAIAQIMEEKKLTLEEMLEGLEKQRRAIYEERYAKGASSQNT
ncbi:MAG: AbrB/MazE/SpoVT family DNA-binding domain-containing protein [Chloroflexota bacterium]|nr:AbrB/MazE/SpoVT family DNA-binding domain-containing protein [Chloroflexota bacterium]